MTRARAQPHECNGAAATPARQVRAGHLPGLHADELDWQELVFRAHGQQLSVAVPRPTPAQLQVAAAQVKKAADTHLANMPVAEIVTLIDRTVARMLAQHTPERQEIERQLAIISGFDPETVRLGLNASLKTFRRPQLLRFLAEDFSNPAMLDEFQPTPKGGWSRACGPRLLGHVWAGNVPALPLWSLIAGLLVKSGSLGKVSSDEPLFAGWFARMLAETDARLADVIAVAWWPGENQPLQQALCASADVLMAYGGDTALASWQRAAGPGTRVLAHGHKLSVGLVAASALDARQSQQVARSAALDMVRWDQQGCYSPQAFYVERGGQVSPREFARQLAGELAALSHPYPRHSLALEESTSLAAWRQAMSMRELQGQDVSLMGTPDAAWGIAYVDASQPPPACALNRSACVLAVDSLEQVPGLLASHAMHLQTAGIAACPETLFHLSTRLAQAGVTRICALGAMSAPEAGWHHDGRFSLLDLVRMVDIETSAMQAAEQHASYRD